MKYHQITCIVERNKADKVVDEAIKSGAQAATVFNARGRGIKERLGFIGKLIQHEKEVILIVTKEEQTQQVYDAVVIAANLNELGRGFAYVQSVEQAFGFIQ
ncbi:MAG: P-II family nitrogen regulator [Elusimicrobiota bacterium]